MTTGATPRMTAALRNAEFRALWAAEAQSNVGNQLTKVTLAILVYDRTESALWAAVVYALTYLPALAGGLGLAQLADRYPRRSVLTSCSVLQAGTLGLMAIPAMPLGALCALLVLAGLIGAPVNAAQNSTTREIFHSDELYLRSQDLRGVTSNVVMLLGLACGGVLVAHFGTSVALAVDAATFAVSAVIIRRGVEWRAPAGSRDAAWFGAIRWVFDRRDLRVLLALSWLVGLAAVPEGIAAPLAEEVGASDSAVGWLLAADPFGFVIGTFLLSRFVSAQRRRQLLGLLAVASAGILTLFAVQPGLVLALVLLALAGGTGAYIVTVGATFISRVPNEIRGGAGGVYRTGLRVAQGVGIALGGAVAEWAGSAGTAIALAGTVGVVLGIPTAWCWARAQRHGAGSAARPTRTNSDTRAR